ncbi:hypothetical protein VTL71DRAFT_5620 [Oculimacula yallundae]|uniref:Uncharacterized protein n=1 Tax=Oculimacula yallundae TaxID=86028 RepID=A0ABR4C1N9_9HELO
MESSETLKPHDGESCPSGSKPHRLEDCPGPVDVYGYVPGCGPSNTLDHNLATYPKYASKGIIARFIFRFRDGKPPMIWDTDLLDPSFENSWYLTDRGPDNSLDPTWKAGGFDIAILGPQIHPSANGMRSDVRGDVSKDKGPAQHKKSTERENWAEGNMNARVKSSESIKVHRSRRTPPYLRNRKIRSPGGYVSDPQAYYMTSTSTSPPPNIFDATHWGSSAGLSQRPAASYDVNLRPNSDQIYGTMAPVPNHGNMLHQDAANTIEAFGEDTQTKDALETGRQSYYGISSTATSAQGDSPGITTTLGGIDLEKENDQILPLFIAPPRHMKSVTLTVDVKVRIKSPILLLASLRARHPLITLNQNEI